MATSKFSEGTLLYTVGGRVQSKKIPLPAQRYELGITKQREGYVLLGWFKTNPASAGYGPDNYKTRKISVPQDAGLASLKVGGRVVSKAT